MSCCCGSGGFYFGFGKPVSSIGLLQKHRWGLIDRSTNTLLLTTSLGKMDLVTHQSLTVYINPQGRGGLPEALPTPGQDIDRTNLADILCKVVTEAVSSRHTAMSFLNICTPSYPSSWSYMLYTLPAPFHFIQHTLLRNYYAPGTWNTTMTQGRQSCSHQRINILKSRRIITKHHNSLWKMVPGVRKDHHPNWGFDLGKEVEKG